MSDKNIVESLREIAQDLLVPELKAVKVSVDALRTEMTLNNAAIREEMKLNNEAIREEMKLRFEASDRHTELLIRSLADRFDSAVALRESVASLEARMPHQ